MYSQQLNPLVYHHCNRLVNRVHSQGFSQQIHRIKCQLYSTPINPLVNRIHSQEYSQQLNPLVYHHCNTTKPLLQPTRRPSSKTNEQPTDIYCSSQLVSRVHIQVFSPTLVNHQSNQLVNRVRSQVFEFTTKCSANSYSHLSTIINR